MWKLRPKIIHSSCDRSSHVGPKPILSTTMDYNTVSPHLMSLIGTETISKTTYKEAK